MNPVLMQYGLAQEQADGALGSTNSPISNGALTAIRSVKRSLAMDEAEKRRALGLGIMGFASSLSQPGHGQGLSGMLSAVNAGFSPAIQAYLNEQNRVEQQNANILKTAIDAEDKQAERDYKKKYLDEMKRSHNLEYGMKQSQLEKEYDLARVKQLETFEENLDKLQLEKEQEKEKTLNNLNKQESMWQYAGRKLGTATQSQAKAIEDIEKKYAKREKRLRASINNNRKLLGLPLLEGGLESKTIKFTAPDGKIIEFSGNITPEKIDRMEQRGYKIAE